MVKLYSIFSVDYFVFAYIFFVLAASFQLNFKVFCYLDYKFHSAISFRLLRDSFKFPYILCVSHRCRNEWLVSTFQFNPFTRYSTMKMANLDDDLIKNAIFCGARRMSGDTQPFRNHSLTFHQRQCIIKHQYGYLIMHLN